VAVRWVRATNAALDQIELDPGIGSPMVGKQPGIPGFRVCRSHSFRGCGCTSSAAITWMWSGCWVSVRTSGQSWAPSSPRTERCADCVCEMQSMKDRFPAVCWPRCQAEPDPSTTSEGTDSLLRSCRWHGHRHFEPPSSWPDFLSPPSSRRSWYRPHIASSPAAVRSSNTMLPCPLKRPLQSVISTPAVRSSHHLISDEPQPTADGVPGMPVRR
jgi:hypothetical protein